MTNVATGQGFFNEQPVVSNPDTETVTTEGGPLLSLVKLASPSTYAGVGDVVSYSFVLTNSGNVSLSGPFTIDDDKATDESCPVTASLAPAASITCTATYTITQADLDAGSVTNVATGQGFFNEQPVVSNPDTETVTKRSTPNPKPSPKGAIGDLVWEDTNADGYQGDFESGVAGVTVHLLDDGGLIIDTASTDASGNYLFSGLSAGTYEVQFILPAGFEVSPAPGGSSGHRQRRRCGRSHRSDHPDIRRDRPDLGRRHLPDTRGPPPGDHDNDHKHAARGLAVHRLEPGWGRHYRPDPADARGPGAVGGGEEKGGHRGRGNWARSLLMERSWAF